MAEKSVSRESIITAVITALRPLEYIHAVWEGGAASWGRVDDWSDIDLYVVCNDDCVEDTFAVLERTISELDEIDLRFRVPEPAWHGHSQVFWRLKTASPFLFLDIAVMKKSSKDKFLQYRIHGKPYIHFDKIGIVEEDPVDPIVYADQLAKRLAVLKTQFAMFQVLVLKELNRGNCMEALSYYLSYVLRPLVEVLRMKHTPWHYRFFTTYIYYEMPQEITDRLQRLYFVHDVDALKKCREEADAWFWDVVASIDLDEVRRNLDTAD